MLFDPDAGKSLEEIILRKWDECSAKRKAQIEQIAKQRGKSTEQSGVSEEEKSVT